MAKRNKSDEASSPDYDSYTFRPCTKEEHFFELIGEFKNYLYKDFKDIQKFYICKHCNLLADQLISHYGYSDTSYQTREDYMNDIDDEGHANGCKICDPNSDIDFDEWHCPVFMKKLLYN